MRQCKEEFTCQQQQHHGSDLQYLYYVPPDVPILSITFTDALQRRDQENFSRPEDMAVHSPPLAAAILSSSSPARDLLLTTNGALSTTIDLSCIIPTPRVVVAPSSTGPAVHVQHHHRHRSERCLAAAPAENLYPLSIDSSKSGQPVRVSYGSKTHSEGWRGVMTLDLMTLEMARESSQRMLQMAVELSPNLGP